MDSYIRCASTAERDNLLGSIKVEVGKRNIGKQLAQLLAKLYSTKAPLT